MDTTEKLKALALAATPGPWQWWTSNSTLRLTGADGRDGGVLYGYVHSGDGDVYCSDQNRAFIEGLNPAAVLELIAEVERLRAELAAGAARQGGDTSQCVACEGSPSGDNNPCAVCGCSAPAAGTDKDAVNLLLRIFQNPENFSHDSLLRDDLRKFVAAITAHTKAGEPT